MKLAMKMPVARIRTLKFGVAGTNSWGWSIARDHIGVHRSWAWAGKFYGSGARCIDYKTRAMAGAFSQ